MAQGNIVHSVDKAMTILEIMLERKRPISLNELSQLSGYPKSTIHAMLSTLRDHNVVDQMADGKYYLGIKLFEFGSALSSSWDISSIARPYLEDLAYSSGGSAFISALVKYETIIIDECSSNNGLRIVSDAGSKMPLHCTSQGKVLLSNMSDRDISNILDITGLKSYTPHTIKDKAQFMDEIRKVREQGYATEDGEHKVGLRSASAPIYDNTGKLKYTISIIGLFKKVITEEFQEQIVNVCEAARKISEELGYKINQ